MRYHDLIEAWHDALKTPFGVVDVFKNPSRSEFRKLLADVKAAHGDKLWANGLWLPLRANISPDGSLYVWDAHHATHSDVIGGHNIPTVGGYLYLGPDFVFFNDLEMEYAEDDGAKYGPWLRRYYEATRRNTSLKAIFGPDFKILGEEDGLVEITDEFIAQNVA
jgi:hypothetical protein